MESPDPGGQRTVPWEGPGIAPVLSVVFSSLASAAAFRGAGARLRRNSTLPAGGPGFP